MPPHDNLDTDHLRLLAATDGARDAPATLARSVPGSGAGSTAIDGLIVRRLTQVDESELAALADVLIDCVAGGASVSFMHPLGHDRALAFWRGVAAGVAAGERALMVAEDGAGRIVGTVQLVLDQPDNQPHRADLSKMLVHRSARRLSTGAALMQAAEQVARECGKTLLVLDTASADAERLYERHGWVRCGRVPGYALLPQGGLCDTVFFYRELG
jgi:GNAT superfamily N-acetyltransferase